MPADDGVVAATVPVEPPGRALVQAGAVALRQRPVCGVSEQDVMEAVRVVAGLNVRLRSDEALPAE